MSSYELKLMQTLVENQDQRHLNEAPRGDSNKEMREKASFFRIVFQTKVQDEKKVSEYSFTV